MIELKKLIDWVLTSPQPDGFGRILSFYGRLNWKWLQLGYVDSSKLKSSTAHAEDYWWCRFKSLIRVWRLMLFWGHPQGNMEKVKDLWGFTAAAFRSCFLIFKLRLWFSLRLEYWCWVHPHSSLWTLSQEVEKEEIGLMNAISRWGRTRASREVETEWTKRKNSEVIYSTLALTEQGKRVPYPTVLRVSAWKHYSTTRPFDLSVRKIVIHYRSATGRTISN